MLRRDFIRLSSLATASISVPGFLHQGQQLFARKDNGKRIIIIQLTGGNDGLNTIIPYADDQYFNARGRLAIHQKDALRGNDLLGFHPALNGLRSFYDQGWLTVINSVGYPEPNLSHFRSMDIWNTGSSSRDYWNTGWLGRYLDNHPGTPHEAVQVDQSLSLALKGGSRQGFALRNPASLKRAARSPFLDAVTSHHQQHDEEMATYLYQTLASTQESAAWLVEKSRHQTATASYPASQLGRDLKVIAELITADTGTSVFYASQTGYDTHVNQSGRQDRLLRQYDEAVSSLVQDLKQHDLLRDTLILTFSEFGRRVNANGSGGTDHGTANALWMITDGHLQTPGFFNPPADLNRLVDGNLIHQVDFRSVYASVIQDWLDTDPSTILLADVPSLPLFQMS
ncbi:MAG: DUF1501 domain-containing protein [Saprospiraceae bacterium]|nr:DUF1501 domain-containing protein [Saprospiraceae bacterium]